MSKDKDEKNKVTLESVHLLVNEAKKKNLKISRDMSDDKIEMIKLTQDTGHLKLLVYGICAALVLVATAGWQMYLHLDDKIEHKMDYMNIRIDSVVSLKSEFNSVSENEHQANKRKK